MKGGFLTRTQNPETKLKVDKFDDVFKKPIAKKCGGKRKQENTISQVNIK